MMAMRVGVGYVVAVITALVVERVHAKHGDRLLLPIAQPSPNARAEDEKAEKKPWMHRLGNISQTALNDFIDITVYLILGALLAAFVRLWLTNELIGQLSSQYIVLAILAMMGVAILLCLCSEADAFVAASFAKLAPAAKLGFLVLGPMLDLKLYFMYTRVFRRRLIWTIITCVVVQVFVYSLIAHLIFDAYFPGWTGNGAPTTAAP
jgi:uncharacterized membrane protein YraQ (UPF0718 family)